MQVAFVLATLACPVTRSGGRDVGLVSTRDDSHPGVLCREHFCTSFAYLVDDPFYFSTPQLSGLRHSHLTRL